MARKSKQNVPRGFTGKRGDRHYWRGIRWHGPTNLIGAKPRTWVQNESGAWGLTCPARVSS